MVLRSAIVLITYTHCCYSINKQELKQDIIADNCKVYNYVQYSPQKLCLGYFHLCWRQHQAFEVYLGTLIYSTPLVIDGLHL